VLDFINLKRVHGKMRDMIPALPVIAQNNGLGMDPSGTRLRVLVVDDNVDLAESVALLLRMDGHEVMTAADGPAALEIVSIFNPQVVVLDIGLPGMDGYEVARQLRAQSSEPLPLLIALTGYDQHVYRQRGEAVGFDYYLVKPSDPELLLALIAAYQPM
jgi:CheY-like chemotaxis protein